jgi:hypothetical protein
MSEKPSILKAPQEHFNEAAKLSALAAIKRLCADMIAVDEPIKAAEVKADAQMDVNHSVYQIAKGLEAVALLGKVGIKPALDSQLQAMVDRHQNP